ncbi:MAG TPA: IS66 family transposase [Oligoflexus sp.]|uniref:IS66 family transposase n=1 Tax=Oligoflexus sp. TaxID=1971216 RepID=UPI002D68C771|nr:IS66 family transposase [Oligoflexus sp.]HYX38241.1 IS66 family transposase [Oligoflexus sp.]
METSSHQNIFSENEALKREIARLREDVAYLEELVKLFKHQKFGSKSEANRHPGEQLLFNEAEADADSVPIEDTGDGNKPKDSKPRGKPSRKALPERLPRVERIIDLPEDEKFCPVSGRRLHRIGEEVTEQLDIVPATVQVIRTIRLKYACSCGECTPKAMPLPPQPIPKSMASPGLLAFIATSKYADGMPLYRQEAILQRIGCDIPRATLASWIIRCGDLVTPLINLLREKMLEGPLVQCDESPIQVLKVPGKKPTSKSFMWITARWDKDGKKIVLYEFSPTRSSEVPLRIFKGYKGYVQTDGYEGYSRLGLVPGIVHVGDWVHVRRKFKDAIKGQKAGTKATFADHALGAIKELYRIENECVDDSTRLLIRQTQSRNVISDLRGWLDTALHKVPPKSLTGQALAYLNGQWPKLIRFLDDPVIGLDTNFVENSIRPFALGRGAWLFSDTVKGANASAALYSLVITARANSVEPYYYLSHIFSELPRATSVDDFEALLPWNFLVKH